MENSALNASKKVAKPDPSVGSAARSIAAPIVAAVPPASCQLIVVG